MGGGIPTMVDETKKYVLLVEDNPMISETVVKVLQTMDIVVIVAENGKIGVDKFTGFIKEG